MRSPTAASHEAGALPEPVPQGRHTKTAIPSAHPRHACKSISAVVTPGNHGFNSKAREFFSSLLDRRRWSRYLQWQVAVAKTSPTSLQIKVSQSEKNAARFCRRIQIRSAKTQFQTELDLGRHGSQIRCARSAGRGNAIFVISSSGKKQRDAFIRRRTGRAVVDTAD